MVATVPSTLTLPLTSWLAQEAPAVEPAGTLTGSMGYDLTAVLVFALFGIAFVVGTVSLLSRLMRPAASPADEPAKTETYECGEPAVGTSWVRFDIRFYTVALVFLIFDVEVAFLFPWSLIFKDLRQSGVGSFLFLEMLVFIVILLAGYVYCWVKGDLDWIKATDAQGGRKKETDTPGDPASEADAEVAQAA